MKCDLWYSRIRIQSPESNFNVLLRIPKMLGGLKICLHGIQILVCLCRCFIGRSENNVCFFSRDPFRVGCLFGLRLVRRGGDLQSAIQTSFKPPSRGKAAKHLTNTEYSTISTMSQHTLWQRSNFLAPILDILRRGDFLYFYSKKSTKI